ncbi:unnamed protein product [Agarophyton chilense]
MSSNVLQAPVAEIQRKLKRNLPWGSVAASLVSLLRRYSAGLSLSVACDEILAQHQSQLQSEEFPTHFHAVVIQVSAEPPEIWLIRLTNGRYVAFYAHSKLLARFKPGVSFSFPSEAMKYSRQSVQIETLAFARKALSSVSTLGVNPKERENARSPVDVAQLNRDPTEHAEALVKKSLSMTSSISAAVLPTPTVLIDLDSLPANAFNVKGPVESFTLQRVWNERSLAPKYIFARVVQVQEGKHIRIQDQSPGIPSTQPSVLWLLHEDQYSYANMIEKGCHVLLERPVVQPNGNSFFVIANECTTCFYRKLTSAIKIIPQPVSLGTVIVPESPPRKRLRRDPDLSKSLSVVDSHALAQLLEPHLQGDLVVFSKAVGRPVIENANLAEIRCLDRVCIRVVGTEMVTRCKSVLPGNQLLFEGVRWVVASVTFGSQTSAGWAASSFHNLSSLSSILHSPLLASFSVGG